MNDRWPIRIAAPRAGVRLCLAGLAGVLLDGGRGRRPAGSNDQKSSAVRAGFAGQYKVGYWTPVEVTVRRRNEPAAGRIGPYPARRRRRAQPGAERPWAPDCGRAAAEQTRTVFVKFGQAEENCNRAAVEGGAAGRAISSPRGATNCPRRCRAGRELLVMVGPAEAGGCPGRLTEDWKAEVRARLAGFELAADPLVRLRRGRPARFVDCPARHLPAVERRVEALEPWVRLGGRLLLASRPTGPASFGPRAPLARFSPGKFDRDDSAAADRPLETFAGTSERLDQHLERARLSSRRAQAGRRARPDRGL